MKMPKMRLALRVLVVAFVVPLLAFVVWRATKATPAEPARQRAAAPGSLACYEAARDRTALPEHSALQLCDGARTTQPVVCYETAQDRTALAQVEMIDLCVCARSIRPVTCFERARDETDLAVTEILQMCNARTLNDVVLPGCISA